MTDIQVTYTLEIESSLYVIEHVPARLCKETGEQYFAPETVERIQSIVLGKQTPKKLIQTPVFEYA